MTICLQQVTTVPLGATMRKLKLRQKVRVLADGRVGIVVVRGKTNRGDFRYGIQFDSDEINYFTAVELEG